MNKEIIINQVAQYVEDLYTNHGSSFLLYHNIEHTRNVVKHAGQIAIHYTLEENDNFILLAAAWFHDTGHLFGDVAVHEATSVELMKKFFEDKATDPSIIVTIADCIMATKMPVAPVSLLQEIICDADTWHLGTMDFHRLDALVWKEMELRFNKITGNQLEKSLYFLETHQFYTAYCLQVLSEGKDRNIEMLKTMLQKNLNKF